MLILGLNAYHGDSSACLLADGEIVAAVEEERFRRLKHWAGFPTESIRSSLDQAGVTLAEVDHVAINSDPKAALAKRLGYVLRQRPSPSLILDRLRNQSKRVSIEAELARAFPDQDLRAQVHRVEHHLAHLASCYLVSPFDDAVMVSVDGFGDFSSAAWGVGEGGAMTVDGRVSFPHSLGVFYQALTQFLGFPHYGDEYKIMGLAPYGEPRFLDAMREIVDLRPDGTFRLNMIYFRHHRERVAYTWTGGSPAVGTLYADALSGLLGPARAQDEPIEARHHDLARSVQAMYEEAFFHLLNHLHDRYGVDALTLAGGCAMNSVANGKVRRETPFKQVYIQAAAGDAGGALGAALQVWQKLAGSGPPRQHNRPAMTHAYWGPEFSDSDIAELLESRSADIEAAGCRIERVPDLADLCRRTASAIADGSVVGWFQGRMEWGPRALGNRSILCDARRADMKDILNLKIKRRESFRPFAPSILRDHVADWFEEDGDVPFMMRVFQIREDKRAAIPAVTHVDGSGRLQTVHEETNPRYYGLIQAFFSATGVPLILNTSFNENEPIVCHPSEALDCFLRTKMDVLVLGDWFVSRLP